MPEIAPTLNWEAMIWEAVTGTGAAVSVGICVADGLRIGRRCDCQRGSCCYHALESPEAALNSSAVT
jgi:hypothetical protein